MFIEIKTFDATIAKPQQNHSPTVVHHAKMKIKLFLLTISFYLFLPQDGFSQVLDTIKGRIISSITMKRPIGEIYVLEKWTPNGVMADSLGNFYLIPLKEKSEYILQIMAGNYDMLEYKYKSEWSKRKNLKSIVVNGNCEINKRKALADLRKNELKLYIFGGIAPIGNTRKDSRFEKKFKIKYWDFGCEAKIQDCILDYNNRVFKFLDIKYGNKWRKMIREDVVGFKNY